MPKTDVSRQNQANKRTNISLLRVVFLDAYKAQ